MGDYNCDSPLTLVQAAADVMDGNTLIINNATTLVVILSILTNLNKKITFDCLHPSLQWSL